ncbi:phosphate ABC transporter substrate-binding protein PstS [Kitasatospora sp. NBC_01287]|uniref:phosphate ABC transporter substrate-binding protein PstS n=1 Tax=Kitasatospora sp. NBC_01287 TaxID=2903573 RepID=UPI00225BE638|nr:phosphate ABC transporter substrate-binding protein PstS [Kitasatospora sp. NBC_01287]MCX4747418.1 phosphate ABC transporter substrate-binding protein PstS [Kitasatospora sp. NBC_01287]
MKLQRNGRTKALAIGAVALVSSLSLAACGSDNNTTASSSTSGGSSASAAAISCASKQAPFLGAGSTAQTDAIDVWKTAYGDACSGSTLNYNGVGSGAGVQQFNQGKIAFAGSDAALKPADVASSKAVCPGGQGIDLPMVGGLVSIIYNVQGVSNLVLDAPTIAKIFNSEITNWNDPAIKALNPTATLPDLPIQAFHRSDDSGTTQNLTAYLAAASNNTWTYPVSKTWAGKGGQSASGSAGVSSQVKATAGSIGYAELSFAQSNNLNSALISTGASQPVAATAANAATTIATAKFVGTGNDLALSLDYATKTDNAYPIVLVTYEIVCDKGNQAATLDTVKSFLTYTISDAGQAAIGNKGFVPLPKVVTDKVKAVIPTIA